MKFRLDQMVQRDFNYAIVDEVDSILIDERARRSSSPGRWTIRPSFTSA